MHLCAAYREDTVSEIPVREAKKARRVEQRTVFLIECEGGILLHKRPPKGLLAGLWEYPNISGYVKRKEIPSVIFEMLRAEDTVRITSCGRLSDAKHIFTHIEWQMQVYEIKAEGISALPEDYVVVTEEEMKEKYSVPSAFAGVKKEK